MKNVIYFIVSLLFCTQFSLNAQSRQHPVTKSNGNPDCISVRVSGEGDLSISESGRRVIVSWYNAGNEGAQELLDKLYVVAYYNYNNSRVIFGSRPLTDASNLFSADEIPDFTALCLNSYGPDLITGEIDLSFDQSLFPAPVGICDEGFNFTAYMDVMYWNGNQLVALNLALLNPEEVAYLNQLFPPACFWNPINWNPLEFTTCVDCERGIIKGAGGRFRAGQTAIPTKTSIGSSPNPFTNNLTARVQALNTGEGSLVLFDLQGRQFLQQSIQLTTGYNEFQINTSDLADGIYFLRFQSSEHLQTIKVIKRKP